tara:strand:+ start:126 stop:791 length:666 start_codon:yes stop_codon:yes gene_type:complete
MPKIELQTKKGKSSFFWKFSRDGDYSKTYVAFIIDVQDSNIQKIGKSLYWLTSFNSLCRILMLLQDVELYNAKIGQKSAGLKKKTYVWAINNCGYNPPDEHIENRYNYNLVCGKAVMGKHKGFDLDWGYYEDNYPSKLIKIDVTDFEPVRHITSKTGIHLKSDGRDLLKCYRKNINFTNEGWFWDLMPRHIHTKRIFEAMKLFSKEKGEDFVEKVLAWNKI